MTHILLRRGGISALACVAVAEHDDASSSSPLLPCTFQVKHSDYDLQATFSLQCRIHIDGFDHEQSFVLLYHADNLVTGTPSCEAATRTLLPTQLAQIARDTRPEVKALSLNLVNPCPILCPDVAESIAPKYDHYTSFYQLVNLAKATEVTILFDWKWLLPARQQPFVDVVSQPQRYSAFPVDNRNLKGRRVEDWTVFTPVEDNASNNGSPPSYAETAGKRPRQASTSSSNSPPSKRVLYSPLLIPVGSPTEKATTTTASIPSPKAPFSPIADHLHTSLAAAIRPIMKEMLPEMLTELMNQPHSFSSTPPPTLSHPLHSSPSPTATPQLPSSSTLRTLRTLLTARAATYVEAKLRTICADTADEAHLLRATTDDEFLDIIANHKLDCQLSTNDTLAEAQQDMDDKLRAFQDKTNDIIAEAEEQVELLERSSHEKLQAQINKLEQDSRDNLKAQMETLERETRDKLRAVWQQTRVRHDRIRAASI